MLSIKTLFEQRINAPMFIYSILYDKPAPFIRGRECNHSSYVINNINIDKAIPKDAIFQLFKIKEIELTSSCQGSSDIHPTFLIFRPINQDKNYVLKIVNNLNKYPDIKAGYDIGNGNKYRIGITNSLYYSKEKEKEFNTWWKELFNKIKRSL
jgi:hypothetical protein